MAQSIFSRRELKRKFLGLRNERPKAEPGRALVLIGEDAPIVLYPGQSISPGEAVWGKYDTVYEVDITQKQLDFQISSPAKGGVWEFTVRFSGSYQVSDPIRVVNESIQDPTPMLELVIKDTISQVTQQFDIEDGETARLAVRGQLEKGLTKDVPFRFSAIFIELEPDQEAKEYLREQRRQKRQAVLIKGTEEVLVAQGSIEKLKRQMQREGEEEMVDHYEKILDKGITSILAQQLAQNPDNAPQITNFLLQLHQQDVDGKVQLLQTMVDNDLIEDWQLRDLVDNVVHSATTSPLQSTPKLSSDVKGALPANKVDEVTKEAVEKREESSEAND